MNIFEKVPAKLAVALLLMSSGFFVITDTSQSFSATPGLTMASSSTFGVLASSAVTSAAPSNISGTNGGNVGVGGGTAPTGSITRSGSQVLGGAALTALSDANSAFSDLRTSVSLPVELGSTTLTGGAYSGGTFAMNGTLTLDGLNDPTSVFIFRTAKTLITAASSKVLLIHGAQACNVFWQIGSSATLGGSSTMAGHLIASASITTSATTIVDGQLIALTGAVTLGGTTVVNDGCVSPTHTVTFLGNGSNGGSTAPETKNATTPLTLNGFTRTGYTYSGWNSAANDSGTPYANSASYSFAADLTLYAQWTLIPPPVVIPTPPVVIPTPPVVVPTPPVVVPTPPQPLPIPTAPPVIIPTLPPAIGILHIIKLVENRFGGVAVSSDFVITIRKTGSGIHFDPVQGTGGQGTTINLTAGSYNLSEIPTSGYRGVWSGAITPGGRVLVRANQDVSVTRTNFDLAQSRPQESPPTPITPTPPTTVPPNPNPPQSTTPGHTVGGGVLPTTASPWGNLLVIGLILMLMSSFGYIGSKYLFKKLE